MNKQMVVLSGDTAYSVETGIAQGTELFKGIFNPLVSAKSQREADKIALESRKIDAQLANLMNQQSQAQTAGAQAQLQAAMANLQEQKSLVSAELVNLAQKVKTEKPTLTPLGWGAVAGAGILGFMLFNRKKKRK